MLICLDPRGLTLTTVPMRRLVHVTGVDPAVPHHEPDHWSLIVDRGVISDGKQLDPVGGERGKDVIHVE